MNNKNVDYEIFKVAIKKKINDPMYMASILGYIFGKDYQFSDVAKHLGISDENLIKLALCKSPKIHDPSFLDKVNKISMYIGIDNEKLLDLIRQSSVIEKMADTKKELQGDYMIAARRDYYENNGSNPDDTSED